MIAGEGTLLYTAPGSRRKPHIVECLTEFSQVAMGIYVAMSLGRPEPFACFIAHALKLVGGSAGGYLSLEISDWMSLPV